MVQEKGAESLDDLMMGTGSERVTESDEVFAQRLVATQAKLAQISKDESTAKSFDRELAKIIPSLDHNSLHLVINLVDANVPSLTILSILSLVSEGARKICYNEINKYIEERADFTSLGITGEPEERVALWWTFIMASDHLSSTVKLRELRTNKALIELLSLNFFEMVINFLNKNNVQNFDKKTLEKVLGVYEKELLGEETLQ